jgi:hypothetical protein
VIQASATLVRSNTGYAGVLQTDAVTYQAELAREGDGVRLRLFEDGALRGDAVLVKVCGVYGGQITVHGYRWRAEAVRDSDGVHLTLTAEPWVEDGWLDGYLDRAMKIRMGG